MEQIGVLCDKYGILLMSDVIQVVGKLFCYLREVGVYLMVFFVYKMYGLKGVGGFYVSCWQFKVSVVVQVYGGGYEQGLWLGMLNVLGIVGFGKVVVLVKV